MATIQNLNLAITNGTSSNRAVKVTGQLKFTAAEIGKKFGIRIRLYGDDSNEGGGISLPIYTFTFGNGMLQSLYKTVTAAATLPVNEEKQVAGNKLNEDPGFHAQQTPNGPIAVPNADEVYALVTLFKTTAPTTAIASKKSPTVTGIF